MANRRHLATYVTEPLAEQIDAAAAEEGMPRAQWMRRALQHEIQARTAIKAAMQHVPPVTPEQISQLRAGGVA